MPYIMDDEFCYWSIGAWIAGYDWSGVTRWNAYYSYGYGFILALIIKLTGNMLLAYKIAIAFNGIFLVGIFLIVYFLINQFFKLSSQIVIIILSSAITLLPNNLLHVNIAWTETLLSFLVWAVIAILVKWIDTDKIKYLYMADILMVYGYMVHNRLLVIPIAFVLLLIYFLLTKKISVKDFLFSIFLLALGIGAAQLGKNYFYTHLWHSNKVARGNGYSTVSSKITNIFSGFEAIEDLFISFAGKLLYFSIATLNMGILGVVIWIKRIWRHNSTNKTIDQTESFIWLIFLLEVGLTVVFMAGTNTSSINPLLYGRYADIFVGPILFIIFYRISKNVDLKKSFPYIMLIISYGINIFCSFVAQKTIQKSNSISFGSMNSIFLHGFWKNGRLHLFWAVTIVFCISIFCCLLTHIKKKREYIIVVVCCIFICYNMVVAQSAALVTTLSFQEDQNYMFEAAQSIDSLTEKKVCFLLSYKNAWENRIKNILQFIEPEMDIIGREDLKNMEDEEIIVTSQNNNKLLYAELNGFEIVKQIQDVVILKKNLTYFPWKAIDEKFYTVGLAGQYKGNSIISTGTQGSLIEVQDFYLSEGSYMLKTILTLLKDEEIDKDKEIGFVSVLDNNTEIVCTKIYVDNMTAEVYCPIDLNDSSNSVRVILYLYDNISAQLDELSICNSLLLVTRTNIYR